MLPSRIHISARATEQLKQLKSRTGVTPNILCRMALALSIEEKYKVETASTDLNGSEFNLPTLLGEAASIYEALLIQLHGNLDQKEAELVLASHIDNGIERLKRTKNILDLLSFA